MNQKRIQQIILNYENDFPVDKWMINGVPLWPNIRFKLYFYLLHSDRSSNDTIKITGDSKPVNGLMNVFYSYLKAAAAYLKFYRQLHQVDTVFMGLKMHRVTYKNKWFNRFFGPIMLQQSNNRFLHLEVDELPENVYFERQSHSLPRLRKAQRLFSKINVKNRSRSINSSYSLPDFNKFIDEVSTAVWFKNDIDISFEYWNNWCIKVYKKSEWFEDIFKKARVQQLVIASYYGYEDTAAAIIAAHRLGIPSADFQHGPQTGVHMAYTSWTKLPSAGYITMPTHYWCWDQPSAHNINQWHKGARAVALGNPWLQLNLPQVKYEHRHILYTLQVIDTDNLSYFFTNEIIKAMATSSFPWVLRLHPRNIISTDDLIRFLDLHVNRDSYQIQLPHETSLISSLAQAVIHLTNFSGCFLEAYQMGITNVILDQTGCDFYVDYMHDDSNYFISKTTPDFKDQLEKVITSTTATIEKKTFCIPSLDQLFKN